MGSSVCLFLFTLIALVRTPGWAGFALCELLIELRISPVEVVS